MQSLHMQNFQFMHSVFLNSSLKEQSPFYICDKFVHRVILLECVDSFFITLSFTVQSQWVEYAALISDFYFFFLCKFHTILTWIPVSLELGYIIFTSATTVTGGRKCFYFCVDQCL